MKKFYFILLFFSSFLFSCSKNDTIQTFDDSRSYVYFAYPTTVNNAVERYIDSLNYSFALDEKLGLTTKIIAIPIRITGINSTKERNYKISVDPSSDYDPSLVQWSNTVIGANKFVDTLYITIKRGAALSSKAQKLVLNIDQNDAFKVGNKYNKIFKFVFSDVLTQPTWWNTWSRYFGPFQKEKFQKWMQIYYLGVDPSPDLLGVYPAPYYYWNNMPTSANVSWYPITFFYIDVLRQYFIDNVVYPNGDSSQERILLP